MSRCRWVLCEQADWEANNQHRIPKTKDAEGLGRRKLPMVGV